MQFWAAFPGQHWLPLGVELESPDILLHKIDMSRVSGDYEVISSSNHAIWNSVTLICLKIYIYLKYGTISPKLHSSYVSLMTTVYVTLSNDFVLVYLVGWQTLKKRLIKKV